MPSKTESRFDTGLEIRTRGGVLGEILVHLAGQQIDEALAKVRAKVAAARRAEQAAGQAIVQAGATGGVPLGEAERLRSDWIAKRRLRMNLELDADEVEEQADRLEKLASS